MNFQHPPALSPPACRRMGLIVKVCAFSSYAPGMDNLNLHPLSNFEGTSASGYFPKHTLGSPVLSECSGKEYRPTHEKGRCEGAYFVIRVAASTIDRAPMPKWSMSSSGFPLCGIVRTASLCTLMPSGPTALSTASPRPPCA